MAKTQLKPHAIIFPVPYQGHINPFVNLAIKLASKGFTITFVHFEFVHRMLSESQHTNANNEIDFFSEARDSGLDIRYTTIGDGFPLEFDRLNNFDEFWTSLLQDFPARVDEFIGKILQSEQSMVSFLIVDTFFLWPPIIAKKYNLVNVSFFKQSALVYSIGYHLDILRENGHYPLKENVVEEINYIPGVITTQVNLMELYEEEKGSIRLSEEEEEKMDWDKGLSLNGPLATGPVQDGLDEDGLMINGSMGTRLIEGGLATGLDVLGQPNTN